MPTGYTSKLHEGQAVTKEEFIWDCARAFGALIQMRDEPRDKKVPDKFEPNRYYLNQKEKAEKELEAFLALSLEEIEQRIENEFEQEVLRVNEQLAKMNAVKSRYEKMLKEVSEWEPPTEEHVPLKEFCIKQLKESIEFDCGSLEHYENRRVVKSNVEAWVTEMREHLEYEVRYFDSQWAKEQERMNERNSWIHELRNSLNGKQ